MRTLYIHIPFCLSKCPYCAFHSVECTFEAEILDRYVDAVIAEAKLKSIGLEQKQGIGALFLGGGTPSILSSEQMEKLFEELSSIYVWSDSAEISIEMNPGSISADKLRRFRNAGVNRLSIGVQSFNDNELKALGRIYKAAEAESAIFDAHKAGFTNISIDLMYGLAGQSASSWQKSIKKAVSFPITHLSAYQLTIEPATPYEHLVDESILCLPDELEIEKMDQITKEVTNQAGFSHYEISNYCRSGHKCVQNLNYWNNGEYIGIGAGAVQYIKGCRETNEKNPETYIDAMKLGKGTVVEEESLFLEDSFRETVVMGLRLIEGVSIPLLKKRFNLDPVNYYGETLLRLEKFGMIQVNSKSLKLTEKGLKLANTVMAELV